MDDGTNNVCLYKSHKRDSSSDKLSLISQREDLAHSRASACLRKLTLRRTIRIWNELLHRCFTGWASFSETASKKHLLELRMRYWKAKSLIQIWNERVIATKRCENLNSVALKRSVHNTTKRYFLNWHRLVRMKKTHRWESRTNKNIALGVGILNVTIFRVLGRKVLLAWHQELITYRMILEARLWNTRYCLKNHFRLWQNFVESEIIKQDQNEHRRFISATLQDMKLEKLNYEKETHHSNVSERPESLDLSLQKQDRDDVMARRNDFALSMDEAVLEIQKKARKERFERQKQDFHSALKLKWGNEEKARVEKVVNKTNLWLKSQQGKDSVQKYIKKIEREIKVPSVTSTEPSSIALSILDSKLGQIGLLAEVFFDELEGITADNTTTRQLFEKHLQKYKCDLDPKCIRDIFDGGLGTNDLNNNVASIDALKDALKETTNWIGVEGSRWKKYIHPLHQMIVFHNVPENKQLMEYNVNRRVLKQVAIDHFLHEEITKERRQIFREQKLDIDRAMRSRAAQTIENFWIGRKRIEKTHRRVRVRKRLLKQNSS